MGLGWDNGKENGNYSLGFRVIVPLKKIEYGVYGDGKNIPKAIFYLPYLIFCLPYLLKGGTRLEHLGRKG